MRKQHAVYALSVMELPALLELLYSATDRSRTVRATVHRVTDQARELDLLKARGLYRDPPKIPPEEGSWHQSSRGIIEATTRLWAARPHRLRWETTFTVDGMDERTSVGVKDRELFWQHLGDGEIHTNEGREDKSTVTTAEELLLDPSALLGSYRFEVRGATSLLDRAGCSVAGSRRFGAHAHAFGHFSDELAFVVDEQRGVLLRVAAVVDGEELSHSEMLELAFDEDVAPDLFLPLS
jgi:hypothetical protein